MITDRDQLLMTSRSLNILLSDRGKPYSEVTHAPFEEVQLNSENVLSLTKINY